MSSLHYSLWGWKRNPRNEVVPYYNPPSTDLPLSLRSSIIDHRPEHAREVGGGGSERGCWGNRQSEDLLEDTELPSRSEVFPCPVVPRVPAPWLNLGPSVSPTIGNKIKMAVVNAAVIWLIIAAVVGIILLVATFVANRNKKKNKKGGFFTTSLKTSTDKISTKHNQMFNFRNLNASDRLRIPSLFIHLLKDSVEIRVW